jgi:SAM-dependent methyltransferase
MEIYAQQRLESESENWLNRGRAQLLELLLLRERPSRGDRPEILELGAGAGQNTKVLSKFGAVDVVEVSPYFARRLEGLSAVRRVYQEPIPELVLDRQYDILCAMDVLEHIEDDAGAVDWIFDHLTEGGIFIGTVPAYQWLFSDHDRANQHYRRYTQSRLQKLICRRLKLRRSGYFNAILFPIALAGRAAWQAKRKISPKTTTEGKQSSDLPAAVDSLFGKILSWEAKRISRGATPLFGLSVFCVAERAE